MSEKLGNFNSEQLSDQIDNYEIKDFIKDRKIDPEDVETVAKISNFPKSMIIKDFHNFFNLSRENSTQNLERSIEKVEDIDRKELYKLMLSFSKKYDWTVCYGLVRIIENIREKKK